MAEFSIIERYCQGLGADHSETQLGVGDDAAVIRVPDDKELAISVDTMVEGVHFHAGIEPADLAHKLLAVNLSDMAAMGACAQWATLTLTIPNYDEAWLAEFSKTINSVAQQYDLQLIGGDTTQGPLNVSLQIMGVLPLGQSLKRSGAEVGDDVYVSNTIGDAALALKLMSDDFDFRESGHRLLLDAIHRPQPQCELGLGLLDLANSCIDISDGLVADLGHISKQSGVSLELNVASLPLSESFRHVSNSIDYDLALTGGDDYQLAFTAAPCQRAQLEALSTSISVPITQVGRVVEKNTQAIKLCFNDKTYVLRNNAGFEHFS